MNPFHSLFLRFLASVFLALAPLRAAEDPTPASPASPASTANPAPKAPTPPKPPTPPEAPDIPDIPDPDDEDELDVDADSDPIHGKLNHLQEVVQIGKRVTIRTNETAPTVVVLFENAVIDGRAGEVVVIGGTAEINGRVSEQVVAVLGKVKLGPNSRVGDQVVAIGGGVERANGARVRGNVVSVPLPGMDKLLDIPESVTKAMMELVVLCRPLSLQLGWVWKVYAVFVLISLAFAVVFPGPMKRTLQIIESRPTGSFVMGMATLPLGLIVFLLLAATGIGLLGLPFLLAGLIMSAFFGKAAITGYAGTSVLRQLGLSKVPPLLAILCGSILLAMFYLIPFLGMLVWMLITMWGMGAATLALFSGLRDESPQPPDTGSPGAFPPPPHNRPSSSPTPSATSPVSDTPSTVSSTLTTPPLPIIPPAATAFSSSPLNSPPPPNPFLQTPESISHPRAGFWRKAGAVAIDFILLSVVMAATIKPPLGFLLWIAYFTGMWYWKGTTIGGLVLGLRVVRLDDRPMDLPTALVRALGGALGILMCFLGLLWCAWDPEKQGWHDKMAGTVVIRTNSAQPLI